jgi:hypothetical protein
MDLMYTVTVKGTGAAITISPKFTPQYIKVINLTGLCTLEWTSDMGAGKGFKVLTGIDGTSADTVSLMSYISTKGITMDSNGRDFTIGTDTDINVNNETLIVCCFR